MKRFHFIIYVADQRASAVFYHALFDKAPTLDVPGMTEFELTSQCKLGIMPEENIARIIAEKRPHPAKGSGIPRCELYLVVDEIRPYYERALRLEALLISDTMMRNWGHKVCYFADPDGHIIAFAEEM